MKLDPITYPDDHISLAGRKSPGLAEVVGASRKRRLDARGMHGMSGATVVYVGDELCRFSVKIRLYSKTDFAEWAAWSPWLYRSPAPANWRVRDAEEAKKAGGHSEDAGAFDIYHPLLAEIGIVAAIVEEVLAPEQTDDGEWTIEIKFLEYREPFKALASPKGPAATPADPDPVEVEIGRLTNQAGDLAAQ